MSKRVWQVVFVDRRTGNPAIWNGEEFATKQRALSEFDYLVRDPELRVWVEHHKTGERMCESAAEIAHQMTKRARAKA
jgi:hypothetical protein